MPDKPSFMSWITPRTVLLILLAAAIIPSAVSLVINLTSPDESMSGWWQSWLQNFSTEMLGALTTYVLLELIVAANEKSRDAEARKQSLMLTALAELRTATSPLDRQRILARMQSDHLLENADLSGLRVQEVRLTGANLRRANLSQTSFRHAEFSNADLTQATLSLSNFIDVNLQGAVLTHARMERLYMPNANLQRADLSHANLWGANLGNANLRGANLRHAKLWGANLANADLTGADIRNTDIAYATLHGATLPDGRLFESREQVLAMVKTAL